MNSLFKHRRVTAAAGWRCSPAPTWSLWDAWTSMDAPLPRKSHVLSWTVGRLEVQMKVSLTSENISTCLQAIVSTLGSELCETISERAGCQETARSSNPCGLGDALERARERERRVPVARATLTTHSLMSARPCGQVSLVGGKHGPRGEHRAERCHRMSSISPRRNQGRERWRPSPESSESQPLPHRQDAKIENRQIDTATAGMCTVQNCST